MITLFFFFLLIPCATPLYFNLPSIGPSDSPSINSTGDAYITLQGIQLTPDPDKFNDTSLLKWKAGRATYIQPLHLWDKASGNLTNFSTNFSFVIKGNNYGEGLAFFLAPDGSSIRSGSAGGGLGLVHKNDTAIASSANAFVAVKFDSYQNTWEIGLPINHVGININARTSVAYRAWASGIAFGETNEAQIIYNSGTQNLSVVFTNFIDGIRTTRDLSYKVDLREHLPEWVNFGFSASTGESYEKHSVISWEFTSSFQVDEYGEEPAKEKLVVGLSVVGSCVLVGGLALLVFCLWMKSRPKEEDGFGFDLSMDNEFETGSGPKRFSYGELSRATNNFAEEQKLGEGGFGVVYRGFLRELNSNVAVKRISKGSKQGTKEYASEVKIISRLRHRNLVQLIGWCHEKRELLLVYEFMENDSLDSHLFKEKSLLAWATRYRIAQGLALALLYLHEEWEQCVVHRDVKSSNVMLDSNFNPKLGDFGLARLVDHDKGAQTTVLAGTMGYLAPECVLTGKAGKESDVYSFGVAALEIACGRKPIKLKVQESQIILVEWVWDLYGTGKLLEAADPKLGADFDEEEMECLMIVGLWCVHPDHNLRPSIKQAIQVLNFEAPLPILPSKMPVATYFTPPVISSTSTSSVSLSYAATPSVASESSQIQLSSYSNNTDSSKLTSSSAASSPSVSLLYAQKI